MRFRVGSTAFFEGCPGFQPNDIDELDIEDDPKLYHDFMQIRRTDKSRCLFKWRRMSPDEFVAYALKSRTPMEAGKFLVPAVAEYLGFTLEHLAQLEPVFDRMDEKHEYERIIFRAYMENGAYMLTPAQRDEAYDAYKRGLKK